MGFRLFIDVLVALVLSLYYWLESIVLFFLPKNKKDVRGDVVLITGAGSGLGQLMSLEFAKLGCTVVGWDISDAGLDNTKKKLAEIGLANGWHSYKGDISDKEQVYELAEKVQSKVGDVTILINNAGIVTGKKFSDCSDELMMKTMDVNATAHFWTMKAFLPGMLRRNNGHIVTIASAAGLFGVPALVDYCASKFAAVGFAEALHTELAYIKKTGIKSTLVCPYYINTGMFDGVKSALLPITPAKKATAKIVEAILTEQTLLLIPRDLYIMYALKGILPEKCYFTLGNAMGIFKAMDSFVGRSKSK